MYFILMSVALVDEICSTVATNIKIKQDRQFTCNVTLRRVRVTLLPWKNKTCNMFPCLCVAVGARARARTGACAHVPLIIQHATRRRYCRLRPFLALQNFSTLSHTRHDFRRKVTDHKIRVFCFFCTTFV